MSRAWSEALAACEAWVAEVEASLERLDADAPEAAALDPDAPEAADADAPVDPAQPLATAPPPALPDEPPTPTQRHRLAELHGRIDDVRARMATRSAALREELATLDRRRHAARRYAALAPRDALDQPHQTARRGPRRANRSQGDA